MEEKVVGEVDSTDSSSSRKRREEKFRKRDPKAWENVAKTLGSLSDTDKYVIVGNKYNELYDEYRKVSQNCQSLEKTCSILQKEKEHSRSEQTKSILARSRLENLCRELQKQNKQIKEENIAKIKEEEERRKEVAAKFQKTLDEITSMMNENREKNFKLRDDNVDMSNKISELYEEFQKREEDLKRMSKQMNLEKQLAKTTINKLEFELNAERVLHSKEISILQNNLEQSEARNKQLLENIKTMEEHLAVYKGQYEDFESTLDKSNKIFGNCKSEMVKMSKQIILLEKEVNNWKHKWQVSASSLIELSTAKHSQDLQLTAANKKIEQLQKLCRQLQIDRGSFLKLLKSNGIEPVTQTYTENSERPPTSNERELMILKNSLKILQEQLQIHESEKGKLEKEEKCHRSLPAVEVEASDTNNVVDENKTDLRHIEASACESKVLGIESQSESSNGVTLTSNLESENSEMPNDHIQMNVQISNITEVPSIAGNNDPSSNKVIEITDQENVLNSVETEIEVCKPEKIEENVVASNGLESHG